MIEFSQAVERMRRQVFATLRNYHVAVRNTPYIIDFTDTKNPVQTPILLIPSNKNRINILLAQVTNNSELVATYSFGNTPYTTKPGPGGISPVQYLVPGFAYDINANQILTGPLGNGTISIDDIYVTINTLDPFNRQGYVIGYEAVLAVEANRLDAA